MKKKRIQVSVLLALLCIGLISAKVYHKQDERKAMHKEMRAYAEQHILPIMKEQRLKLDKKLSAQEKAAIANVREELKAGHAAKRAEMKKLHEQVKSGEIDKEKMHEHFKAMRTAKKEKMAPIKAIADKYESKIEKLLEVAKENKETWKQGMEAIRRKYISDEELEQMKEKHHARKRHHMEKEKGEGHDKAMKFKHRGHHPKTRMGRGGHHMKMMHHAFRPVGFVLWDPNAPIPSFEDEELVDNAGVYPNPSRADNKISFAVQQKGQVKIELLDKQGSLLKTVLNDTKDKGEYTVSVDLGKLPNAVYYYRITTASGSKTIRFLIEK